MPPPLVVISKFRSKSWPGNYIWSFSYGFGVQVRDIWTWRPGFHSEIRYKSVEHSALAWGAILRKLLGFSLVPRLPCSFFQEHVPKIVWSLDVLDSKGLLNMDCLPNKYGLTVHIHGLSSRNGLTDGPYMDFLPEMD